MPQLSGTSKSMILKYGRKKGKTPVRYRRRYRRMPPLLLPNGGIPRKYLSRHRYCQEFSLNPATGTISANIFRANSLFDPDLSGVGHQPLGFDQLSAWFDHYRVLGSKITVTHIPNSTTHVTPAYVGILLTDTNGVATSSGSVEHLLERRSRAKRFITNAGIANQGVGPKSISHTFSAKRYFGKQAKYDDKYGAAVTANPSEGAFFEVFAASINGNDPGQVDMLVQIDYIAQWSEPKSLAQS